MCGRASKVDIHAKNQKIKKRTKKNGVESEYRMENNLETRSIKEIFTEKQLRESVVLNFYSSQIRARNRLYEFFWRKRGRPKPQIKVFFMRK